MNDGADEERLITSGAGLMRIEQLIMHIATSDARVSPTTTLMQVQFMRDEQGSLPTVVPGSEWPASTEPHPGKHTIMDDELMP